MPRELLTGNAAAAWGARCAEADYVPAFPITPQTEIIEMLVAWLESGAMKGRLTMLESEHSMVTAAAAAAAAGARVFTATSSQGLLYAMEMLYAVPGWRVPFVLVNVSRGLAIPITLEPDHNDILAARDSGCLQIHCAGCQEVLDSVLIAYRIAEHARVRLPVIVNMDGFHVSFTREPVEVPNADAVRRFLPRFAPLGMELRASRPISQAVAALGSSQYSYFRYETHLAALEALAVYDEAAAAFSAEFGRDHASVEAYRCEDAEIVFLMIGSFATKARAAADVLRHSGTRAGLVRPRLLRPFPSQALKGILAGKRAVAVVDQNLSFGKGGVLHTEVASALYGEREAPVLVSFVGGLGGRDITLEEFCEMAAIAQRAAEEGCVPPPRLLFTDEELREMRTLQAIAAAERSTLGSPS